MKIFFDFDDVLFYTDPFIHGKQEIFARYGIPYDMYRMTYEQSKSGNENTLQIYDMDAHIHILKNMFSDLNEEGIRHDMENLSVQSGKFIFPDVSEIVQQLKSEGHWLGIVSYGQSDFQMSKIRHSGLVPYFDKIIVGKERKSIMLQPVISKISDGDKIWFLDDSPKFLEDVKQTYPQIQTVQVMRKEARWKHDRCASADFVACDMIEIRKIIQKEI